MNKKTNNDELLDDVLSTSADFRDALLDKTLQQVRRRRRFRQGRNAAGLLVVLALVGLFILQRNTKQSPIAIAPPIPKPVEQNYTLVTTQPLAPLQLITSNTTVAIVQTTPGNVHLINDEQLLALLAAHPAALVRTGPHSEKLIFANPADQNGLPEN
jgi:hypothetical protein